MPENPSQPNPIYLIYIYRKDLALYNLQWLICHKTQQNQKDVISELNEEVDKMSAGKGWFDNCK